MAERRGLRRTIAEDVARKGARAGLVDEEREGRRAFGRWVELERVDRPRGACSCIQDAVVRRETRSAS